MYVCTGSSSYEELPCTCVRAVAGTRSFHVHVYGTGRNFKLNVGNVKLAAVTGETLDIARQEAQLVSEL